jgi:class 3 adenylate cyclase/tetratricopeptide (TPR) repeat protein
MTFDEIIDRAIEMLRRRGRVTYRTLRRQFDLDDAALEDLKHELIVGQRVAIDDGGDVLVWSGEVAVPTAEAPSTPRDARDSASRASVDSPPHIAPGAASTARSPSSPPGASSPHSLPSSAAAARESTTMRSARAVDSTVRRSPSSAAKLPGAREHRSERAERRQITILFCDIVGSAKLSSELDPEDLRELVRAYQEACGVEILRFQGYVAQYLGDGILAYFGWPVAHEAAAESAVRAALACVDAVARVATDASHERGARLSVRIGIHTGVVVVGEMGAGPGTQQLALGEAPNVAARVQALAEPDTILLTETTHKLVGKAFDLADLGPTVLKGIHAAVRLYRVVGESADRSLDDARAIVGRARELSLVREALGGARRGRGIVLLVSGEAGIGKSRLAQAARDLAGDSVTHLAFRCSPYQVDTALHPFVDHLERRLGIARDATPRDKLALLRAGVARTSLPQDRAIALLAPLLSIPSADVPTLGFAPQRQKDETLALIASWFADDARKRPVLAVWEDLQWADASTLQLLSLLVAQAVGLPALYLLTHRPEFEPPFRAAPAVREILVTRFAKEEIEALVGGILGGKRLSPDVLALVAEKTDGVPLFVEEIVRVLLESGELVQRDQVLEPSGALSSLSVPSTLHDSLMARLDRMTSAKEVAQLAATLGRDFTFELLSAIAPIEEPALRLALRQLIDAELLFAIAGDRYVFKHALIQDVAYQSLLRATRQRHHERIARTLEGSFRSIVEQQPELVAHHFAAAGLASEAIPYHERAGARAVAQSAYVEAGAHFSRALAAVATLPESIERDRLELDLLILRGVPETATRGYGAPEVREGYARARELAEKLGESDQLSQDEVAARLFAPLYGLWRSCLLRAEYIAGLDLAEQLLAIAGRGGPASFQVAARRSLGAILFYMGDYARSAEQMRWVLSSPLPPDVVRSESASYEVVDSYVTAHCYLGWATWMLGEPVRACLESDGAVDIAADLGHGFTRALALSFASWLHQFRRDVPATRHRVEQALVISTEKSLEMWVGWGTVMQGWIHGEEGRYALATATMREGIDAWRSTGSELGMSYFFTLLAEAEGLAGNVEAALEAIADAERFAARTQERFYASETLRTKGTLHHLAGDDPAVVKEALLAALHEARRAQATTLAVRAAASLVRCLGRDYLPALKSALAELGTDCRERDVTEAQDLLEKEAS